MEPQRISVWVVPEAVGGAAIQALMDELAMRFDGPWFPAHLTVFAGTFEGTDALVREAACIAREVPPLELAFTTLDVGERFTKCLFARFAPDDRLAAIGKRLRPLSAPASAYRLDPHVSLYYGERPAAEAGLEALTFPAPVLRFDRLVVNRSPERSTRRDVVESWEQVLDVPLTG